MMIFCGSSTCGEMRCRGKRELGFYLLEMLCRVKTRIELIMLVLKKNEIKAALLPSQLLFR